MNEIRPPDPHLKGPNKEEAWASMYPSPDPNLNGALDMQPKGLCFPGDFIWGETWLEMNTCTCRKRLLQDGKGVAMGGSCHL